MFVDILLQVVAGTVYKFDLELHHNNVEEEECRREEGEKESCHVEVSDVPWEKKREILWYRTTCSSDNRVT